MKTRTNAAHTATEVHKTRQIKFSILSACIEKQMYDTFVFNDDSMKMNFNYILEQFDCYYSLQKNVTFL